MHSKTYRELERIFSPRRIGGRFLEVRAQLSEDREVFFEGMADVEVRVILFPPIIVGSGVEPVS